MKYGTLTLLSALASAAEIPAAAGAVASLNTAGNIEITEENVRDHAQALFNYIRANRQVQQIPGIEALQNLATDAQSPAQRPVQDQKVSDKTTMDSPEERKADPFSETKKIEQIREVDVPDDVDDATKPISTPPLGSPPKTTLDKTKSAGPKPPTFNPATVNATTVTAVDVELAWPFACSAAKKPTVKLTIDADAVAGGAAIHTNPNGGFKAYAGDNSEIKGKQEDDAVGKSKFSTLVYTSEKEVTAAPFKLGFLFLAQKVEPETVNNTYFDIELTCGSLSARFTKAGNNATILKVSSATATAPALAALLLSLLALL